MNTPNSNRVASDLSPSAIHNTKKPDTNSKTQYYIQYIYEYKQIKHITYDI